MAVSLRYEFPGIGRADYDAVNAKLGLDGPVGTGDWPEGMLSHAAAESGGALYVIEVWESREAQGRFMQSRLGPAIQETGITVVPKVEWIDLFTFYAPKG